MEHIHQEILALNHTNKLLKHEQFIEGFLNAMQSKTIAKGDRLPSVNELSNMLGFSTETILKGYRELIKRGIVVAQNRVGYFMAQEQVHRSIKIALVLFEFDSYQETIYKDFQNKLKNKEQVDVYYHHNSAHTFSTLIGNIYGQYHYYIISPPNTLKKSKLSCALPREKVLYINRCQYIPNRYSYAIQNQEEATFRVLEKLLPNIKKYKNGIIYFHHPNLDCATETLKAFKKFVKQYHIKYEIDFAYHPNSIEKDKAYFTLHDSELWDILKDCNVRKMKIGKEVGILSHNNNPIKEIICDGITTYGSDLDLLTNYMFDFIHKRQTVQVNIPIQLVNRYSI